MQRLHTMTKKTPKISKKRSHNTFMILPGIIGEDAINAKTYILEQEINETLPTFEFIIM